MKYIYKICFACVASSLSFMHIWCQVSAIIFHIHIYIIYEYAELTINWFGPAGDTCPATPTEGWYLSYLSYIWRSLISVHVFGVSLISGHVFGVSLISCNIFGVSLASAVCISGIHLATRLRQRRVGRRGLRRCRAGFQKVDPSWEAIGHLFQREQGGKYFTPWSYL